MLAEIRPCIAAGEADTDAVNVNQLKNRGSEIVNKGF